MSACVNDTDGDGNCAACARNPEAPCRVGARSVAEHALTVYYEDSEDPAGMARKVLDAYAHELAEKQRQFARDLPAAMGRDGLIRNLTFQEAADLIDPEVSA